MHLTWVSFTASLEPSGMVSSPLFLGNYWKARKEIGVQSWLLMERGESSRWENSCWCHGSEAFADFVRGDLPNDNGRAKFLFWRCPEKQPTITGIPGISRSVEPTVNASIKGASWDLSWNCFLLKHLTVCLLFSNGGCRTLLVLHIRTIWMLEAFCGVNIYLWLQ